MRHEAGANFPGKEQLVTADHRVERIAGACSRRADRRRPRTPNQFGETILPARAMYNALKHVRQMPEVANDCEKTQITMTRIAV